MITYNKRKNSDKWYLPYLNVLILVIIIGTFAAINLKVSDSSDVVSQEADVPVQAIVADVDVSGEWVGMMTEDYSSEVRYDYRVVFDQYNDELGGFTFQESTNYAIEIYAESSLIGNVDGNDIYFYEASTDVLENLSLDRWCRIEVRLNYQVIDGQETLIGTWDSAEEERPGCTTIDGRVVLTRQD
jgi:hypothetical protein